MSGYKAWLLAARPKTLSATLAPIIVGSVIGSIHLTGSFPVWVVVDALFCSLFIQIATNYINDAEDFHTGADTEERLGPTRASQAGLLDPYKVKMFGFFFLGLAFLFGIPLVFRGGLFILFGGFLSLLSAYFYTAGPYPLAFKGLGEDFVLLFFGFFAVIGMSHIITVGQWNVDSFVGGLQVGLHSISLIAINNYRDRENDLKAQKMTLAARFGPRFAKVEIVLSLLLPFFIGNYWLDTPYQKAFYYPLAILPFALAICILVLKTKPGKELNKLLGMTALAQLLFALCFLFAFL